jgi:iron complex transport system substrate-binding protein
MILATQWSRRGAVVLGALLFIAPAWGQATRTLIDQNGRAVELPATVGRIVAIPIPLASMVMAVDGGTARLIGMNSAAKSDVDEGLLGRMFPEAARIPTRIAGENFAPNAEALITARADLVIQWGDRGEAILDPIRALGIPMLTLKYGDSAWAADWLRLTGEALGKPERGEALARWFERRVDEIDRLGAAIPEEERPRVIYLMRGLSTLQVAGKGTSMDGDIRRAGGINPAAHLPGAAVVGIEQILTWDPDIILLNNFEPGLHPARLYGDSRFQGIGAVDEKRVYLYPRGGFRWDPPSQETPLSLEWLHDLFHPQRALPGLRARLAEAYLDLYAYRITEAEIDEVLRMTANSQSAHYRTLFGNGTKPGAPPEVRSGARP